MRQVWALIGGMLALAGCAAPVPPPPPMPQPVAIAPAQADPRLSVEAAARNFVTVVERVEPVAENACVALNGPGVDCDLQIVVVPDLEAPPNAFQTLDEAGRPVVGFTLALIADARNADELAFVLGHEAAHHIAGHIPRAGQQARVGALAGILAAQAIGADQGTAEQLGQVMGAVGARSYAKNYELEADRLGARIAWSAGYDPVRGARFFDRLPDPGDRFLGTHPPNAQRQAQIAAEVARIQAGY